MSSYVLADAAWVINLDHPVINLDHPGTYFNSSFVDISVANLVVIGVMVFIFGLALLVPFPGRHAAQLADPGSGTLAGAQDTRAADIGAEAAPDVPDADMWTARVRRLALRLLPPGK